MISILFPSMAIAVNDKKDKQYMCHGWHGYQNQRMELFDQPISAANEWEAKLSAMQIIGEKVKASNDPYQEVYAKRCDERFVQQN